MQRTQQAQEAGMNTKHTCKRCGSKLDQRVRVTCPDLCGKCWLQRMAE